jgi:hypothetical protein
MLGSSQGRASADVFLWRGEDDEKCLVKVQRHRELVVRCQGGVHLGQKAACCRDVQEAWNTANPQNPAELFSKPVPFAPRVDTASSKFVQLSEGEGWPFDEPGSELNNVMTKEWMDRDPDRECHVGTNDDNDHKITRSPRPQGHKITRSQDHKITEITRSQDHKITEITRSQDRTIMIGNKIQ